MTQQMPPLPNLGFWNMAQVQPDRVALYDPEGQAIGFGALAAATNQVAHALRAAGLGKGDTIALLSHNCIEMVQVALGALQIGIYITPINWHLTAHEASYILEDCGAKLFFASPRFADNATQAADKINFAQDRRISFGDIAGFQPLASLLANQSIGAPSDRTAGAVMTYTSGTTGKPKGVKRPLSGMNPDTIGGQLGQFLMLFGIMPQGKHVHLIVAPLYHTAVMSFMQSSLHFGHTCVLMDKWTPELCLETIERYRVTHSHMVPTMFTRMLQLPDDVRKKYDVSSTSNIIHSAAPCPVPVKKQMLAWWGPVIYEYYGATEGGGTLATPQDWLKKPGTVGKPWPISKIKIFDDDGNELPPGTIGTVYMYMDGMKFEYHGDKQKTNKAWQGDFFTVGDAGYLDEDGFLFLCDRKSDMIISGGVNIYPAEIECEMIMHPHVQDVAVFGIPHEEWGEEVKAVVELRPGVAADEATRADIFKYCADRIAKYKMPKTIDFVAELPREANGKLMKRKLRDPYWVGRDRAI